MPEIKTSVFLTKEQIQKRVEELAAALNKQFQNKSIAALCTLKGAFTFFSDLVRRLNCDMACDFCSTSCYGLKQQPSKEVRLTLDTDMDLQGKHILLVEDIVDRGLTLQFLQNHLQKRKPSSLTTTALLAKPKNISYPCRIDHTGFEVNNNDFLVGYGMDYQEQLRSLPYIAKINNLN